MKKMYVAIEGAYYTDGGCPIACSTSVEKLIKHIRKIRKGIKKEKDQQAYGETLLTHDESQTWVRIDTTKIVEV